MQPRTKVLIAAALAFAIVCAVGGVLSSFFRHDARQSASALARSEFTHTSDNVVDMFTVLMSDSVSMLHMLAGVMRVNSGFTFREFSVVARSARVHSRHYSVQWIPHVTAAEREALERELSADLNSTFVIKGFSPVNGSLITRDPAEDYYPIAFTEPYRVNRSAVLLDLQNSTSRAPFLYQARDLGQPVMSGPISIVINPSAPLDTKLGILIFVPVYNDSCAQEYVLEDGRLGRTENVRPSSLADRRRCIQGFVLGFWLVEDTMTYILQSIPQRSIHVHMADGGNTSRQLFEGTVAEDGNVTVQSERQGQGQGAAHDPGLPEYTITKQVTFGGRTFVFTLSATQSFVRRYIGSHTGATQMALMIVLTGVMALITLSAGYCWVRNDRARTALAAEALEKSTLQAARDASNRIVGYVCHELRNPLHVLDTWFKVLLEASASTSTSTLAPGSHDARPSLHAPVSLPHADSDSPHALSLPPITHTSSTTSTALHATPHSDALTTTVTTPRRHLVSQPDTVFSYVTDSSTVASGDPNSNSMTSAEAQAAIADVDHALQHMKCIVNDVLDYKAIQAGGLSYNPVPVNIAHCLLPVIKRGQAYLRRGVKLRYSVPAELWVSVDVQRVTQIVTNGLSNAGKFTSEGCVSVMVRGVDVADVVNGDEVRVDVNSSGDDHRTVLVIDISNTGAGLSGDVSKLFVPFKGVGMEGGGSGGMSIGMTGKSSDVDVERRSDELRRVWQRDCNVLSDSKVWEYVRNGHGGDVEGGAGGPVTVSTGLGLPLSREFACLCGGWLGLEDDGDGVTHFWCVLPVERVVQDDVTPSPPLPSAASSSVPPSIAVPVVIDGFMTPSTLSVRQVAPLDIHVGGDNRRFAYGLPAQPTATSTSFIPIVASSPAAVVAPIEPDYATLRVIVVDDEAANRRVAERLLLKLGLLKHNITLLDSGEAALAYLHQHQQQQQQQQGTAASASVADAMLLDISMGGMSGMDVMAEVRRGGGGGGGLMVGGCAVIACTAHVSKEDEERYEGAGFAGLLGKPFSVTHVKSVLTGCLQHDGRFHVAVGS